MPVSAPNLPLQPGSGPHQRYLSLLVRQLQSFLNALLGAVPVVGNVSLAVAPATTTDIAHVYITADTIVLVSPTNALAAAEPGMLVTYPSVGVARLTHTANAAARTFRYLLVNP